VGQRVAWLIVVGGGFIVQGLVMVSGIVSARLLGVEGRGEVALVVALSAMAAQLTLGGSLPNAVTKRLAERQVRARDGVGHLVPRWALWSLLAALPAGIVFAVMHGGLGESYVWWLAVMTGLLVVQNIGFRLVTSSLLGEGSPMGRVAVATLLPQTLVTLTLVALFLLVDGTTSLVVSGVMVGAFAIGLVVGFALLASPTGSPEDRLEGRDLWRLTRSTYVGSVGPIDGLALDRTLVGAMLGTVALGLYSAAVALSTLASTMGSGLATVLLPKVASTQADPVAERALVRRWLLIGAIALGSVVTVATLLSRPIIEIALGREFLDAVEVTYWLVPASGLLGYRRILVAVLQGRDRGGVASRIEFGLTPLLVAGIAGAAYLDRLWAVGAAMLAVAVLSVSALAVALIRTSPHRVPARPVEPRPGRHKA
jgi:O-antigen/teichoic acid export membrane protein